MSTGFAKVGICLTALASIGMASAQTSGRSQDGFYSGQANGQYSGRADRQSNGRIDGRPSRNEGLPPSAADRSNSTIDNPVAATDCIEVNAIAPDARPGWQSRVRDACQQ